MRQYFDREIPALVKMVHPELQWQNIFAIFMPVSWLIGYLDLAMCGYFYN